MQRAAGLTPAVMHISVPSPRNLSAEEKEMRNLDGIPLKVNLFGKKYETVFDTQHYPNGRIALQLIDPAEDELFCTLTCNLPDVYLEEDEVLIKNWSENEDVAKAAFASGLFEDTGLSVRTGFVEAPIWRIL
jgi:hypothetical protein